MNRGEAIKILTPFREAMIDQHGCPISDVVFALDVAIKSLKEWDLVIEEITDYIVQEDGYSIHNNAVNGCEDIVYNHIKAIEE